MLHTPAGADKDLTSMGMSMGNVVSGRVVFGVVIGKVMRAAFPIETELRLCFAATEPV